ncbi:hypothetical protein TanjilG_12429 [Lupinus angustifolius]|uniref:BSD domain-containing protein n=1 Tax=Lupinus angustifolius TaxID=3871 RepID=A0A4P1QYF8_LUPAN|nr:PREDICTED: uncharacterized protein LOC109326055 [Lupinus angustifolius]OIV97672.1 hypothetical protein TanjilG_12429 [Lupinus angustifolius]
MAWLAHSLANSLRLDEDENDTVSDPQTTNYHDLLSSEEFEGHGVKEDLNEIKQTLTRQLWGMASFLAPPPPPPPPPGPSPSPGPGPSISNSNSIQPESENEQVVVDAVVSNQIQISYNDDQDQELEMEEWAIQHAVGITDEVLTFAMNISMHPETWLDFPIQEEDDTHDFDMSDAQWEHAMAIERLAPRLAALRIELCPCHMSESYFWKVYFVLLHSRLHKQDAEILSTPQVMAARGAWMQELHKQTKPEVEYFRISSAYSRDIAQHDDFALSLSDHAYPDDMHHLTYGYEIRTADNETEKHTVESSETHFIDKSVIDESPTGNKDLKCGHYSQTIIQDYDDDDDDEWPDEGSDLGGYSGTILPLVNEEDISFSDLEDDDYAIKHVSSTTGSKLV